jgi:hypothetical protein
MNAPTKGAVMSVHRDDKEGQGMIVNPKPTGENQDDWNGDEADRADRLRFEEEQAMIKEQAEARAAAKAATEEADRNAAQPDVGAI